ncbi:MAG: sensor domain-containing diguanylate cyclase [Candidatus Cloacimonetes bacterium]|nr:sensor domain-containing diguanylate cyclase [Candidatus Cloacimonadota bacterium]
MAVLTTNWFRALCLALVVTVTVMMGAVYAYFQTEQGNWDQDGGFVGVFVTLALVAGFFAMCMVFVLDYLKDKATEPQAGEKSVDQIKEDLARTVKERNKIHAQVEETRGRIMSLSSLMVSLSNMAKVVGSTLDPQEVIDITMENIIRNLKATKASIILVNPETQEMTLAKHHGWDAAEVAAFDEKFGEGIVGYVAQNMVSVDDEALKADPKLSQITRFSGKKTYICAPLSTKDSIIGVINVEAIEKKPSEDKRSSDNKNDEMRLMNILTSLAAMAIQNARMFKKTQEWATIDALTGLNNRRSMLDFFNKEVERANKNGHTIAFFMSDIDHFKGFNDQYGHAIGDFVLAGVAKEYKKVSRKGDMAGRYGGEEFGQILPETDKTEARKIAEQLRKNVEAKKFDTEAGVLSVTLCVGIASYPEDGKTMEEVMESADQMLYVCKESGRNQVCVRGVDKINEKVALKIKIDKLKNTDAAAAALLQKELDILIAKEKGLPLPTDEPVALEAAPPAPVSRPPAPPAGAPPAGARPPAPPGARPPAPPGARPPAPPGARPPAPPGARPPVPPGARPPAPPGAPRPPGPPGARPPAPPPRKA